MEKQVMLLAGRLPYHHAGLLLPHRRRRDERGGRFYAVMGHLDQANPHLILRLGMYGHWLYNVPGLALFDDLGPFLDTYVDEAAIYRAEQENNWFSKLLPWR